MVETAVSDAGSIRPGVMVVCDRVSYSVPARGCTLGCVGRRDEVRILQDMTLRATPGRMLTILGPSGSGKSTLLNVISGQASKHEGRILFHDVHSANAISETSRDIRRELVCYVMATGRMLPYLTVEETLDVAAQLKFPNMSKLERKQEVVRVMSALGLLKCRSTFIGGEWRKGISTGERKRVSIATELIGDPAVLLVDEPTSGLDSSLAYEIMTCLKNLANTGKTVVVTVHQPPSAIWAMMDDICVIGEGHVVYCGPASNAVAYFRRAGYPCPDDFNRADFLLEMVSAGPPPLTNIQRETSLIAGLSSKELEAGHCVTQVPTRRHGTVRELADAFTTSHEGKELQSVVAECAAGGVQAQHKAGIVPLMEKAVGCGSPRKHDGFKETVVLAKRSFKNAIRNPIVCCVLLLVQCLQGLILGGIFLNLSKDVKSIDPVKVDISNLVSQPLSQFALHGIDEGGPLSPLVEILTAGIDGRGSQPALDIVKNQTVVDYLHNTVACVRGALKVDTVWDYETTFYRDSTQAPDSEVTTTTVSTSELPRKDRPLASVPGPQFVQDVVTSLQLFDMIYNHYNISLLMDFTFSDGERCKDIMARNESRFWTLCAQTTMGDFLNGILGCAHLPKPYPQAPKFDRWVFPPKAEAPTSPLPSSSRLRKLISVTLENVEHGVESVIGRPAGEVFKALREMYYRAKGCKHNNDVCKQVNKLAEWVEDFGQDSATTLFAVANVCGAMFFIVADLGFISYDALLTFPQERIIFNRESANDLYRPLSYYLAKNIADMPFQILPAICLVTIYYLMVGLAATFRQYVVYLVATCSITFAAYGFGYMVSAASPRMEIAVMAAPVTLVIWLVLAGFFLRDGDLPAWISWFKYFSFYRWGFFAIAANQFPRDEYFGTLPNAIQLGIAGVTEPRVWVNIVVLIGLGLGYRLLGYFCLVFMNRRVGLES